MAAPSAVNRQPWAFVAVTDRGQLDILGDGLPYAKMLLEATAAVVVCGDIRTLSDTEAKYWVQDTSAATQNILLATEALGYGAVWTAVYPEPDRMEVVSSTLQLPTRVIPLNVIPLGIPETGRDTPKDKWNPKKFHLDRWAE
jgi:nitroreductase